MTRFERKRPVTDAEIARNEQAARTEAHFLAHGTPQAAVKYLRERAAFLRSGGWALDRAELLSDAADRIAVAIRTDAA